MKMFLLTYIYSSLKINHLDYEKSNANFVKTKNFPEKELLSRSIQLIYIFSLNLRFPVPRIGIPSFTRFVLIDYRCNSKVQIVQKKFPKFYQDSIEYAVRAHLSYVASNVSRREVQLSKKDAMTHDPSSVTEPTIFRERRNMLAVTRAGVFP